MPTTKVALFGGGPACLMAAYQLSERHEVHIFEKGKRLGRKFLVAGNGGFNLTNEVEGTALLKAYSDDSKLHNALNQFSTGNTRQWLSEIGIETFIGSSGRVFPKKDVKPTDVLKKIVDTLEKKGVQIHLNHAFISFDTAFKPRVLFNETETTIEADHYIFGLGGGSWPKTGSNSAWLEPFNEIGVKTIPFRASNCGVNVEWGSDFKEKYAGTPLKNIAIHAYGQILKGEAVLTEYGLEGNAIYPLVPTIRKVLTEQNTAEITIDFKPNSSLEMLQAKITGAIKPKNYAFTFKITKAVQEIAKRALTKEQYLNPHTFANYLKNVPMTISSLRPVAEAISTVGGINMDDVDVQFRLIKHPHISIVGEMLDWDAPTGGFLLQGCFSTGYLVGECLNKQYN
ncbi:MAG: TIGR03862 family flavoprotein [Crocinitomix sp.]|nr:TIGR03862 family flavoprotein [Crocinitomix sp.]